MGAAARCGLRRVLGGTAVVPDERVTQRPSLLKETRDGIVATAGIPGLRLLLAASGAALLFGAIFNVGQPLLAKDELGSDDAGFAALVTLYGCGFIGGSLSGSKGGPGDVLLRRYLAGAFLMAVGFLTSGLAPSVVAALLTFLAAGYGNGLLLVYERQLIQLLVPDALAGRVFGIRDALTAWAFAVGFIVAPLLIDGLGTRVLIVGAGACGLVVWVVATLGLRRLARAPAADQLPGGPGTELAWQRSSGEHGPDPIGG